MEIIERQGEGKFAIATKSFRKGQLIHAAHPLICVPNFGRIRAGSICCGCLSKIIINNSNNDTNHNDNNSDRFCGTCNACYCSAECKQHNTSSHLNGGECEAIKLFGLQSSSLVSSTATSSSLPNKNNQKKKNANKANGSSNDTDEEVLIIASLVARALLEGFTNFPLQDNTGDNKNETVVDAILNSDENKNRKFGSLQDEIDFVHNQPRVSVGSLFPEFVKNRQVDHIADESVIISMAVPPPLPTPSTQSSSLSSSILLEDERIRLAAITNVHCVKIPSFIDFCDLVSNANAMNIAQLEYIERLRMRFFSLIKKNCSSSSSSSSSIFSILKSKPIDPLFFAHFYSGFSSNCFGSFDPKTDKKVSIGVYPDASFYNSSCSPNLMRRRQGRFECFYATADVDAGETLNIDYGASDGGNPTVESRRMYLLNHYQFWCGCGKCKREEEMHAVVVVADGEESSSDNSSSTPTSSSSEEEEGLSSLSKIASTPPSCSECAIGGKMRGIFDGHQLSGFECRFCFRFLSPVVAVPTSII